MMRSQHRLFLWIASLKEAIHDIIYPRICIGCRNLCEEKMKLFCNRCDSEFIYLTSKGRCSRCFLPIEQNVAYSSTKTHTCFDRKLPILQYGACFEESASTQSLLTYYRRQDIQSDSRAQKALASIYMLQHSLLNMQQPDIIIFVPTGNSVIQNSLFKKTVTNLLQSAQYTTLDRVNTRDLSSVPSKSHGLIITDLFDNDAVIPILSRVKAYEIATVDWLSFTLDSEMHSMQKVYRERF